MANIGRKTVEKPIPPPVLQPKEHIPEPASEEGSEQDRRKKKGRTSKGRGRERAPIQETAEPKILPVIDERPISFDDVPFAAEPSSAKVEPEEDIPSFHSIPPVAPVTLARLPKVESRAHPATRTSEPDLLKSEPLAAPVVREEPREQPKGFGFGIFDE
jgi:hypothetical protein